MAPPTLPDSGSENSVDTLSGWFKEVYADKVDKIASEAQSVALYKDIKFVKKAKQLGGSFNMPVVLTQEHGFTYAAAAAGAFDINEAVAGVHKNASLGASQILLESYIDYESLSKAKNKASFGSASRHVVENMMDSFTKRLEIELLYGGKGSVHCSLGRIDARTVDAGTSQTFSFTSGDWAPGIWAGMENAQLSAYNDDGTGGLPSTLLFAEGDFTVGSVSYANKTVTLTGTEADMDTITSTHLASSGLVYLYPKGAAPAGMTGLVTICETTTSDTLFGITGYALWAGNEHAVGSLPLTFTELVKGHDKAVGRGLQEDVCVYVNPGAWSDIMTDLAALRRYDASYSGAKVKQGSKAIVFTAQFGDMEVKSHNMIKEGIAISISKKRLRRIGSDDITFNTPGMSKEKMLFQLPTNAGVGLRAYTNQALFCSRPAACTIFTGITNSA